MENILEKEPITITRASAGDFDEMNTVFPQSEQGLTEFQNATQGDGHAEYLLARKGNSIVGKLYLNFSGVTYSAIKAKISDCPDLENIEVLPSLRGQGVGTKLIIQAEKICKEKGFTKIGLGVAIDNPDTKNLYEKLGYRDSGFGEFEISFAWRSKTDAPEEVIHEKISYLIKAL